MRAQNLLMLAANVSGYIVSKIISLTQIERIMTQKIVRNRQDGRCRAGCAIVGPSAAQDHRQRVYRQCAHGISDRIVVGIERCARGG